MNKVTDSLIPYLMQARDATKDELRERAAKLYALNWDRSVGYNALCAVWIGAAAQRQFPNTVLSLAQLQKYDDRPFIVCVITPTGNSLRLANSTFLKKISHSSKSLREDNIRGSFNGCDIEREFMGIANSPENFTRLFEIHTRIGFANNLPRLVKATHEIIPSGIKLDIDSHDRTRILGAPLRAAAFHGGKEFEGTKRTFDGRIAKAVSAVKAAAAMPDLPNRAGLAEYVIAGSDARLRNTISELLINKATSYPKLPPKKTLGDFSRKFPTYVIQIDVKIKFFDHASRIRGYDVDDFLAFLNTDNSIFLIGFLGVTPEGEMKSLLISPFRKDLLETTRVIDHWSGRESRGVTQLNNQCVGGLIRNTVWDTDEIDVPFALRFLNDLMDR